MLLLVSYSWTFIQRTVSGDKNAQGSFTFPQELPTVNDWHLPQAGLLWGNDPISQSALQPSGLKQSINHLDSCFTYSLHILTLGNPASVRPMSPRPVVPSLQISAWPKKCDQHLILVLPLQNSSLKFNHHWDVIKRWDLWRMTKS